MRRMKEEPEKLYDAKAEYINEHNIDLHISLPDERAYAIKVIFPVPYFGNNTGNIVAELYPCVNDDDSIDPPAFTIWSSTVVKSNYTLTLSYEETVEGTTTRKGKFLPKNFIIHVSSEGNETFVSEFMNNSKAYYSIQELSEPIFSQYL